MIEKINKLEDEISRLKEVIWDAKMNSRANSPVQKENVDYSEEEIKKDVKSCKYKQRSKYFKLKGCDNK